MKAHVCWWSYLLGNKFGSFPVDWVISICWGLRMYRWIKPACFLYFGSSLFHGKVNNQINNYEAGQVEWRKNKRLGQTIWRLTDFGWHCKNSRKPAMEDQGEESCGWRNSMCKGPEAGKHMVSSRCSVAGTSGPGRELHKVTWRRGSWNTQWKVFQALSQIWLYLKQPFEVSKLNKMGPLNWWGY